MNLKPISYCFSAEAETKAKLDKVTEIKRITTQMMGIKSEISKYEELLKEYQLYKKFLDDVSPQVRSQLMNANIQTYMTIMQSHIRPYAVTYTTICSHICDHMQSHIRPYAVTYTDTW